MIRVLTDRIEISGASWTLFLVLAFCAGLAVGLWIRRPPARRPRAKSEVDTLDGTETMDDLLRRCREPEVRQ